MNVNLLPVWIWLPIFLYILFIYIYVGVEGVTQKTTLHHHLHRGMTLLPYAKCSRQVGWSPHLRRRVFWLIGQPHWCHWCTVCRDGYTHHSAWGGYEFCSSVLQPSTTIFIDLDYYYILILSRVFGYILWLYSLNIGYD